MFYFTDILGSSSPVPKYQQSSDKSGSPKTSTSFTTTSSPGSNSATAMAGSRDKSRDLFGDDDDIFGDRIAKTTPKKHSFMDDFFSAGKKEKSPPSASKSVEFSLNDKYKKTPSPPQANASGYNPSENTPKSAPGKGRTSIFDYDPGSGLGGGNSGARNGDGADASGENMAPGRGRRRRPLTASSKSYDFDDSDIVGDLRTEKKNDARRESPGKSPAKPPSGTRGEASDTTQDRVTKMFSSSPKKSKPIKSGELFYEGYNNTYIFICGYSF